MALRHLWRASPQARPPRSYRHIISLGTTCRSAHHIRRHFGVTEAYPFDWWIFPLAATLSFLEDPNLEKLYDEERLVPIREKGRLITVLNEHYGIQLFHEFPRENGEVISNFADHIAAPKERTRILLERLFSLPKQDPILFVKGRGHHDSKRRRAWTSSIRKLCDLLNVRYGFRDFDLLLVNAPVTRSGGPVRTAHFSDVGADWRGHAPGWDQAFAEHVTHLQPMRTNEGVLDDPRESQRVVKRIVSQEGSW